MELTRRNMMLAGTSAFAVATFCGKKIKQWARPANPIMGKHPKIVKNGWGTLTFGVLGAIW